MFIVELQCMNQKKMAKNVHEFSLRYLSVQKNLLISLNQKPGCDWQRSVGRSVSRSVGRSFNRSVGRSVSRLVDYKVA